MSKKDPRTPSELEKKMAAAATDTGSSAKDKVAFNADQGTEREAKPTILVVTPGGHGKHGTANEC
jgi:hypothetical protein